MNNKTTIIMTSEGYLALEEELNNLKNVERPRIIEDLKEARAQGDLSENADYDSARNEQAQVEAKIKELEYKLAHAEISDSSKKVDKVSVGSKVTIAYDEDDEETYYIVGSTEVDAFNNKISNESPIGKAVLGHKKGEVVSVESPNGSYEVKITNIE